MMSAGAVENACRKIGITALTMAALVSAQSPTRESEASVARRYALGLATNDFRPVWTYSAAFNNDITSGTKHLPQSMWKSEIQSVRKDWIRKIESDRNGRARRFEDNCWVFFRPTVAVKIIETRGEKIFVKVSYPNEEKAPLTNDPNDIRFERRLRAATVLMTVSRGPAGRDFSVSQVCRVIDGTVELFPVRGLGNGVALELAKTAITSSIDVKRIRPSIHLLPMAWNVLVKSMGPGRGTLQENINKTEEVIGLLQKYGVEVKARIEGGYYQCYGMRAPESWANYENQAIRYSSGSVAYVLAESVDIAIVDLKSEDANNAVATVRLAYEGCSPICKLVKELRNLGRMDGGRAWGSLAVGSTTLSNDWLKEDSPAELLLKVWYKHDYAQGWHVSQVSH